MSRRKAGEIIVFKTNHGFLAKGKVIRDERSGYLVECEGKEVFVPNISYDLANASPFQNGRLRAEAYLNARAEACGVRLENEGYMVHKGKDYRKSKEQWSYQGVKIEDPALIEELNKEYIRKFKQ